MSIYSGFATRSMETAYNRSVCHILQLCQAHLSALLRGGNEYSEPIDVQNLSHSFTKIYRSLRKLEQHKHLQPKYTLYCAELAENFGSMPLSHANSSFSSINGSELDLQILNEALVYDASNINRYTPAPHLADKSDWYSLAPPSGKPQWFTPAPPRSKPEWPFEHRAYNKRHMSKDGLIKKPRYSSSRVNSGSPPRYEQYPSSSRGREISRPRKMKPLNRDNIAQLYQQRALSKLHMDISYL